MTSFPSTPPAGEHCEMFSLRGRRALITGSGQGIGFTLTRGLGAAGTELVLNDIDPARLEQAVATLIRTRTPAGRWGEPHELVGTAVISLRALQAL